MLPTLSELFELANYAHLNLFKGATQLWEPLRRLTEYCDQLTPEIAPDCAIHPTAVITGAVQLGKGTVVGPYAVIQGPASLGEYCEVRAHAYIRGYVVAGNRSVIGHSTELKHAILLNNVRLPHWTYVGDSILGNGVHFGGGAVTANFKSNKSTVVLQDGEQRIDTGLTKLGAFIGDLAELGSKSVIQPGSIIGRNTIIYPGAIIRGTIPANVIVKLRQQQEIVQRRNT